MASGSNPPIGSIMEPFTRFAVLSAEEQAWLEHYSKSSTTTIKNGIAYGIPITEENIATADSIASKLPVRRRWRRKDRFGNEWDTRKDRATHFNLTCRFDETIKET